MCMDPRLTSNELRAEAAGSTDECQVTPVIHVLQYPGCVPKPIPSFACIGRCASYIQVRSDLPLRKILVFITDFKIFRYLEVKSGRWKDPACVVKNQVNEKLQYHYFARKLNQVKENS